MGIVWKLTLKRILTRKSFWTVLVLMPMMLHWLQCLDNNTSNGLRAAVYSEDEIWKEQLEEETNPVFYFVDSVSELEREVLLGNAECGYYIPQGLPTYFATEDWYWKVEVYEGRQSMFTKSVNEVLFSHVFQVVSAQWYLEYMKGHMEEAKEGLSEEEILQTISQKLLSGETFRVETIRISGEEMPGQTGEAVQKEENIYSKADASQTEDSSKVWFPTRNIVAVMVYLMSLLATMDTIRDRQRSHFPVKQRLWAAFCTIANPTAFVGAAGVVCILAVGTEKPFLTEAMDMLLLVLLSTVYGMVLSCVVRRENFMYGVIPVLFAAGLVCCPVFVDLGSFIPVFRWIEKLFPMAFYL